MTDRLPRTLPIALPFVDLFLRPKLPKHDEIGGHDHGVLARRPILALRWSFDIHYAWNPTRPCDDGKDLQLIAPLITAASS